VLQRALVDMNEDITDMLFAIALAAGGGAVMVLATPGTHTLAVIAALMACLESVVIAAKVLNRRSGRRDVIAVRALEQRRVARELHNRQNWGL
jgi:hypothetical protein